jgi:hypothetical protein
MTVNGKSTEPTIPTAFRVPRLRRLMLEEISKEREHADLSTTLNEAVDQYIEWYLRGQAA